MKVDIYHQIRWSRYKGRVFSEIHRIAGDGDEVRFFQIADTDSDRAKLGGIDLAYHRYPHEVLFPGAYDAVPRLTLMRTLFGRVTRSDADVIAIAGYDRPEYWAMLAAAVLSGKGRAVFCDSTLLDHPQTRLKALAKQLFFRWCDAFLAYGTRSAELLRRHGARRADVFEPCQAAALPEDYTVAGAFEARTTARADAGDEFLYVGRLAPEKSLPTLLEAFAKIIATRPAARLTVVGSGPERAALEASVIGSAIDGAIRFTGALEGSDLAREYARASALVLPSASEPWGLVVNEALHYGCPVVVSDRCGCVPELVVDGETGFAFVAGDPADLAKRMEAILADPRGSADTARRCQARVADFTPERAAQSILEGCRHAFTAGRRRSRAMPDGTYRSTRSLTASE